MSFLYYRVLKQDIPCSGMVSLFVQTADIDTGISLGMTVYQNIKKDGQYYQ